MNRERYVEYAHGERNAFTEVERPVLEYVFRRFFRTHFNWLSGYAVNRDIPGITTSFNFLIPENFSVLDIGTATGRVLRELITYGVKPEYTVGLDSNSELLQDQHFPLGTKPLLADAADFITLWKQRYPGMGNFDFITANMVFHLMDYQNYVRCLRQCHQAATHEALLWLTVPHPIRDSMDGISDYHDHDPFHERAPWGDAVAYYPKTIQDYLRGLTEADWSPMVLASSGEGLDVDDRYMIDDISSWQILKARERNEEITLPHYFRLWILAYPSHKFDNNRMKIE